MYRAWEGYAPSITESRAHLSSAPNHSSEEKMAEGATNTVVSSFGYCVYNSGC